MQSDRERMSKRKRGNLFYSTHDAKPKKSGNKKMSIMKIPFNMLFSVDMDAQDAAGNTPLHVTVDENAFEAMDYLLSMYVKVS